MARLVLGVAGAAAGFAIGGPTGAQWGWMAGSLVGGLLTTTKRRVTIDESGNQTTQEGAPRAVVYGTGIVTGNIFYGFPARKIETEQGGKGGGPTATSVQYLRTYAIRICEGPVAGVIMVKQDGEIVYDARPNSVLSDEDNAAFLARCTIYLGGEDQLPDPDLEAIKGVGEVPAHRGTAYIVFADDDLTARGGAVPQYEFVVAQEGNASGRRAPLVINPWVGVPPNALGAVYAGAEAGGQFEDREAALHAEQLRQQNNFAIGDAALLANSLLTYSTSLDLRPVAFGGGGISDHAEYVYYHHGAKGMDETSGGTGFPITACSAMQLVGANVGDGRLYGVYASNGSAFGSFVYNTLVSPTAESQPWWARVRETCYELPGQPVVVNPPVIGVVARRLPAPPPGWIRVTGAARQLCAVEYRDGALYQRPLGPLVLPGDGRYDDEDFWAAQAALAVAAGTMRADVDYPADVSAWAESTDRLDGKTVPLAAIISDIHARCGHAPGDYDVSALEGIDVAGLVLASQGYTGADAIDTLRTPYFFDRAEYDGRIHYVPRGAPVAASLTLDDLVEAPDESTRSDPITYPRKLHLKYQSEAVQWEVTQVTSERVTPDVRVVGEESTEVPVVLTAEQAQTIVAKLHKVSWADADGEVKFSVPSRWLRLVVGDCIGLTLRGKTRRLRIVQIDDADGVRDLTCRIDRQSAYSAVVTVIPVPEPSPPASRFPGNTELTVLDIPALTDAQDVLGYYVAGSGARAGFRGYQVQRSTDGGATFSVAASSGAAAFLGTLLEPVAAASPWYTDRTNTVRVQMVRETQELASISDTVFLQRGGAFALQAADGSWEVMQYRDAVDEGGGIFALTYLHRGQLATAATAHAAGARFVALSTVLPVDASSAWLGKALVHRGVSLGQSPDGVPTQSRVYTGQQQREWPVASLRLSYSGGPVGGTLSASWSPRHRFGSDDAPVPSRNFAGYRVYVTDAAGLSRQLDQVGASFTADVAGMTAPIKVAVAARNIVTGSGPYRYVTTDELEGEGGGPAGDGAPVAGPPDSGTGQQGVTTAQVSAGKFARILGNSVYGLQNSRLSWQLVRMNKDTLEFERAAYTGTTVFAVVDNGTHIFVAGDGWVRKFDLDLNEVAKVQSADRGDAQGLALAGGHLWVSNPYRAEFMRYDTDLVTTGMSPASLRGNALATDGAHLYAVDRGSDAVHKLDAVTGAFVASFPVPEYPFDIACHGGRLWVACVRPDPSRLYCFDAATGAQIPFEAELIDYQQWLWGTLTVFGNHLGMGSNAALLIDMDAAEVIGSFSVPLANGGLQYFPSCSLVGPRRFLMGADESWTAYFDV